MRGFFRRRISRRDFVKTAAAIAEPTVWSRSI